jgi:antitoxin HigA-1
MLQRKRRPSTPGQILKELYLKDRNISNRAFAEAVGCTPKHVSNIIHGKARIEAEMATRIAAVLGTSIELWLQLQNEVDIFDAKQKMRTWKPSHTYLVPQLAH